MNGTIAQITSLTCYGNAFIQGYEMGDFFPTNSTCIFCDKVNFITFIKNFLGKWKEKEIAKTPDEWFKVIKNMGARGIRLSRTSQNAPKITDRMSAGFVGGGGTWSMEVVLAGNRSQFWIPRWEVCNKDEPEKRIWHVTYGCISEKDTVQEQFTSLQVIESRLSQALSEIYSFSKNHNCGGFTQWFADAIDTIDSEGKNLHGYHKDLAPDGYLSHNEKIILDACQKSWVFGGMGSWNDLGFDGVDQVEYERVSEQLFNVVNEAIIVGVNSSYSKEK